jgi:hypothetical protein
MVAIQKGRTQEPGADEQKCVVFFGIKPNQRHGAYDHSQQRGDDFHEGMKLGGATPFHEKRKGPWLIPGRSANRTRSGGVLGLFLDVGSFHHPSRNPL